jgi:hypothetical protein
LADIIPLEQSRQSRDEKRELSLDQAKKRAVLDIFQCLHCPSRCARCGKPVDPYAERGKTPYLFCETCADDYSAYVGRLKGEKVKDRYWQNDTWMAVWKTWIDHKYAIDRHIKSREFIRLLEEINRTSKK